MSGNTSATGGYLQPTSTVPPEGDALDDILQEMVVGITGLNDQLVRPRWQPDPPGQPAVDVNWAGVGVISRTALDFPYIVHNPAGNGTDVLRRHNELEVQVSFYGPNADLLAEQLRDGLYISQNREQLAAHGIALIEVGQSIHAPELINNVQWLDRVDITVRIRQVVERVYAIENILSAPGEFQTNGSLEQATDVNGNPLFDSSGLPIYLNAADPGQITDWLVTNS